MSSTSASDGSLEEPHPSHAPVHVDRLDVLRVPVAQRAPGAPAARPSPGRRDGRAVPGARLDHVSVPREVSDRAPIAAVMRWALFLAYLGLTVFLSSQSRIRQVEHIP